MSVTRSPTDPGRVPFAVALVPRDEIARGRPTQALSEALVTVPGIFIADRNNPSQDDNISIRGFGARSAFGARGVKILLDGIPQTLPDGEVEDLPLLLGEGVGHDEEEVIERKVANVRALDYPPFGHLVNLVLAMTDDFDAGVTSASEAREYAGRLSDAYQHHYYNGIIAERQARALLGKGPSAVFGYDRFREAMEWFEKAAEIRPEGNDDAILRWNACVRTIKEQGLRPRQPEGELGLE